MLVHHISGGAGIRYREATLLEALEHRAAGDHPWLTFHDGASTQTVRGSEVVAGARSWAAAFARSGVVPGDRVGVWQPNCLDWVTAFFGAMGAGAVPVPLSWPVIDSQLSATLQKLRPILEKAGIRCLAAPVRAHQADFTWPVPELREGDWAHRPGPVDTAFIQFTSGSTGAPRGAVISHRAALANSHALVAGLHLGPDDIGVSWIPFFHDMGLVGVLLTSLVGGFHVHVMRPGAFLLHPWHWLELIGETRATLTVSPDFGYALATRRSGSRAFSLGSLRCALSGSEPIHLSTLTAFDARFGSEGFAPGAMVGAYGLAENTLGVSVGDARAAVFTAANGRQLPTVGRPLPGTDVALTKSGEICVRSLSLMNGYFNDAEQTHQVLRDGWLMTGDLGHIEAGRLFVVGREKDLVIKAGSKFHPSDIEQVVAGEIDVPPNGVAAFNTDDELVLVIERRRASQKEDSTHLRALIVQRLGVRVDRIEWVVAGTLPRTTSGKLRRAACAQQFGASP